MTPASLRDKWLAKVSGLCLALPEARRELRGDHADFRVRNKVFAYFLDNHHGDGIVSVCVKSELGEHEDRAKARPGSFYLPAYIGKRGWFGVYLNRGPVDWDDVQGAIEGSYRLAAPKSLVARMPQEDCSDPTTDRHRLVSHFKQPGRVQRPCTPMAVRCAPRRPGACPAGVGLA